MPTIFVSTICAIALGDLEETTQSNRKGTFARHFHLFLLASERGFLQNVSHFDGQ